MSKTVYNKKLQHCCMYCVYGKPAGNNGEVFCKKHGVTNERDSCRKYKYDAIKRVPVKVKISNNYKPEDFII